MISDTQKKYFYTLCKTRNIQKASEELFVSRQAISTGISKMEEEVGARLFERKKEGVTLNEAGRTVNECLHQMDRLWEETLAQLREKEDKEINIKLGMPDIFFDRADYEKIYRYNSIDSRVNIEILDRSTDQFLTLFNQGKIDMFYSMTPVEKDAVSVQLSNEKPVLLISDRNTLNSKDVIDFSADLREETFFISESVLSDRLIKEFERYGYQYQVVSDSKPLLTVQLQRNKGILITLKSAAGRFLEDHIVMKETVNCPLPVAPFLVFRGNLKPAQLDFVRYILSLYDRELPQLPEEGIVNCNA